MKNHTPGPWLFNGHIIHAGRTRIASVERNSTIGALEIELPVEANRRLIAAAPEMLEALEIIAKCFLQGSDVLTSEMLLKITDAIKKAKGEK